MDKTVLVKKDIGKSIKQKIVTGDITLVDTETGEVLTTPLETNRYNLQLSNKKQFMKKWTDRKLNIKIKSSLGLLEKELLLDIMDYIDECNIINFRLLANDYGYSASKLSKVKKKLLEVGLIKKDKGIFYLSPLIGIKAKEIPQELIPLFKDSFEKYGIDINFK